MFGPFGLPSFCYSPEMIANMNHRAEEEIAARLKTCVAWDPMMKWVPQLNLLASTYEVRNLFPECHVVKGNSADPNKYKNPGLVSPCGEWLYAIKELPRGSKLGTWYGNKTGSVLFDGPIHIPAIHQKQKYDGKWGENPWMSHTPAEVISMRGGNKRAKGHTIVAGLGLGYQLIEVSRRKSVKKLTLIEKDQGLVDWILPRVKPFLGCDISVIVADAYEEMPKLFADVALVDIFDSYGNNDYEQQKLRSKCKNIGHVWCWGAAVIK